MATLQERMTEYDAHRAAGYEYYNTIRSQLSLALGGASMTAKQVLDIQHKMDRVKNELVWGDWKNAALVVSEVTPNEHLSAEFIQQVADYIASYITDNYSW